MSTWDRYEGPLSMDERMAAYAEVKERFGLKAAQRDMLDATPAYGRVMELVAEGNWGAVEYTLMAAEII